MGDLTHSFRKDFTQHALIDSKETTMSNLWRLKKFIAIDNIHLIKWPTVLEAELTLDPADFFERKNIGDGIASISGDTQFATNEIDGKIIIERTGIAPPLLHRIDFPDGNIEIQGGKAYLKVSISNINGAVEFVDWIGVCLSQFLSVQLGVYCNVSSVIGKIADHKFSLLYPPKSYSTIVNCIDPADRASVIDTAVQLIDPKSDSYPRFVTCSMYYHHALRLLSPYQVNFSIYTAFPEVILNLAKCVELLFPSATRDELKVKLVTLGYGNDEVASQLLSIIIVRNNFDVGHETSGLISPDEIATLRNFANRSIANVGALLRTVATKIKDNENLLSPLSTEINGEKKRILRRIEESLAKSSLNPQSTTQIIITA